MANQTDLTPASNPALGLHIHVPSGQSASAFNNSSDFPAPPRSGVAITVKVNGTPGSQVRFSNPA
jgi:hypothetical protein